MAFEVRRERVTARAPAVVELPLPGQAQDADARWRDTADAAIRNSRVRPFVGPVEVVLTFRDSRRARHIGDLPDACLKLLIATGLIAAADSQILKRLTLAWGAVDGVRVEIREMERAIA